MHRLYGFLYRASLWGNEHSGAENIEMKQMIKVASEIGTRSKLPPRRANRPGRPPQPPWSAVRLQGRVAVATDAPGRHYGVHTSRIRDAFDGTARGGGLPSKLGKGSAWRSEMGEHCRGRHRAIGERSAADRPNASRLGTSQGEALGVWRSTDRRSHGIGQREDQCSMVLLDHPRPPYARSDAALPGKRGDEFFFLARSPAQPLDKAQFAERK